MLRVYFSHFITKHGTIVKDIFHRLGTQFCTVYSPVIGQKMQLSIKDSFIKCDQIRRKLRIWSHLLKKSLMENFIFCAVSGLSYYVDANWPFRRQIHVQFFLLLLCTMKYFRILILNTLIVNFQQETIAFWRKKIQRHLLRGVFF